MPKTKKRDESIGSCSCTQAAIDLLRSTSPMKEGMLKSIVCKKCGKHFLANFDTEFCYDCEGKSSGK